MPKPRRRPRMRADKKPQWRGATPTIAAPPPPRLPPPLSTHNSSLVGATHSPWCAWEVGSGAGRKLSLPPLSSVFLGRVEGRGARLFLIFFGGRVANPSPATALQNEGGGQGKARAITTHTHIERGGKGGRGLKGGGAGTNESTARATTHRPPFFPPAPRPAPHTHTHTLDKGDTPFKAGPDVYDRAAGNGPPPLCVTFFGLEGGKEQGGFDLPPRPPRHVFSHPTLINTRPTHSHPTHPPPLSWWGTSTAWPQTRPRPRPRRRPRRPTPGR